MAKPGSEARSGSEACSEVDKIISARVSAQNHCTEVDKMTNERVSPSRRVELPGVPSTLRPSDPCIDLKNRTKKQVRAHCTSKLTNEILALNLPNPPTVPLGQAVFLIWIRTGLDPN